MRVSLLLVVLGLAACSEDTSGNAPDAADFAPVVARYGTMVFEGYSDALATAKALKTAIDALVASPTQATHDAAKAAWVAARRPYGQTEVYRFYAGPIDDDTTGPEGEINSWPLDEQFIDYIDGSDSGGLIGDTTFVITKASLRAKNVEGGEKNVSVGYHAIEFLLWGQDDPDPAKKTQGARSFEDYVVGSTAARNQERRGAYLQACAELLVDDLQLVVDAWAPGGDNYGKTFGTDPHAAVTKMLTGMGSLANAELSGERMTVAYKDKSQEDEHSCFSDTTNADLQANFLGIANVYLGTYGSSSGPGIGTLVAKVDPALDAAVRADLDTATRAFVALQAEPFDFAIQSADGTPPRDNVLRAIQSVKKLAADVTAIGAALGVSFAVGTPSEDL